jgi:nitrite reductase/ring-hydroxylating ferredoxin subunit
MQHEITLKERKVRVVVVKCKGQLYCLGGYDTFDGTTRLYKGAVFGDKLYSPQNGSAFNVTNGTVEYGPAIDNLPIFQTQIDAKGNLVISVPDFPPKKVRPMLIGRDFNDLRRVVLVGSDPSVISCAETLRYMEYTGDLLVVSDKPELPINSELLRKSLKYFDEDKLEVRDERYLRDFDINVMFDNPVVNMEKSKGQHRVILEDDSSMVDTCDGRSSMAVSWPLEALNWPGA